MYMSMHYPSLKLVMPEISQIATGESSEESSHIMMSEKVVDVRVIFSRPSKKSWMFLLTKIRCLQSLDVFNNENLQGVYLCFHVS